jgi:hypothetical protein
MLSRAKDLFDREPPALPNNGAAHHWSYDVLSGTAQLLNSQMVVEGGKILAGYLGSIWKDAAANAAGSNGNSAGTATANQPSGSSQPPATALSPAPTADQSQTADQPTAEEMAILNAVVAQIRAYENEESTDRLDDYVALAVAEMRKLPAASLQQLVPIPGVLLVAYLSGLNPAWADIANMDDAVAFVNAVKSALVAPAPPEKGSGELIDFPTATPTQTPEATK